MSAELLPSGGHCPINSMKKQFPQRKTSVKYTSKSPARLPEFEMIKPPSPTGPVVVSITEATPSSSASSRKTSAESNSEDRRSKIRPHRPTITIPPKAYRAPDQQRIETPPIPLPPPPTRRHQHQSCRPEDVPLPRSCTDTPDHMRTDSRATTAVSPEPTPVMRSMFPTYDTDIPLANQNYCPNPSALPGLTRMRDVAVTPSVPRMEQKTPSTNTASAKQGLEKKESPLRRSESLKRPTGYSKPEEIIDLWSLANGQAAELATGVYALELSCDDLSLNSEIITFSTTTSAVYALAAAKSSQISSTRIHPVDTRTRIPVCSTVLNRPSRQDPLIASIFPKAAGLMALDQSSNMAIGKGLDRQASALLQAEAIKEAQEREASMLLWDCDSGRFCLLHPSLLDDVATTMRIEITPSPTAPQQITFFAPETSTPLLEMEMSSLALSIHVEAIKALPSLYILDTLVTSMLTLLLHLHRLCADPSNRHSPQQAQRSEDEPLYFPPPPPSLHSSASRRDLLRQRADSRHSTFRSVRSVKSSRSLASGYDKDIELGVLDPETGRASKEDLKLQKKKAPKGVVDVDDPALPKGTRAALRFMYWIFEVLYWILGALIQFAAVGVVALGKFVQKL